MSEPYHPQPLDTSQISLPEEVLPLIEKLAKNVHEKWAEQRMQMGWKYGPVRNDLTLEHPCLIPYEELPEKEKEIDRASAVETLKLIILSGFEICKKQKH